MTNALKKERINYNLFVLVSYITLELLGKLSYFVTVHFIFYSALMKFPKQRSLENSKHVF